MSTATELEHATAKGSATKYVYFFGDGRADGHGKMKDELGGKGAGLAEMTNAGLPVPPGFTIQTEACREYMRKQDVSSAVNEQMDEALRRLEQLQGQKLGGADNPLLVSVRSGAKFSMPGMMDTILNLGLNDKSVEGLAKRTNNPRFAYDSYRRLIQMFGSVVLEIPSVAAKVRELRTEKNYCPALVEISRLRKPVDLFFDKVMVMVDDERVRANRLALLRDLLNEFSTIADFSEIVTETKSS